MDCQGPLTVIDKTLVSFGCLLHNGAMNSQVPDTRDKNNIGPDDRGPDDRGLDDGGFDGEYGYCTMPEGAEKLSISYLTMREWIVAGKVKARRFGRNWLLPLDPDGYPQVIDEGTIPFVPVPPEGYLPLPEAAEARGITRQRLYQLVQQGRIPGCVRSRGTRRGVVIWVPPGPVLPPKNPDNPARSVGDTVTISEAAKMAGLSRQHFFNLLSSGQVKGAEHYGRSWVIPRDFKITDAAGESIPEDWVDIETASQQYGFSVHGLARAAREGLVPAKKSRKHWYFAPYYGEKTSYSGLRYERKHAKPERWLTTEEAAEERSVTTEWLREQARRGDIPAKKVGLSWYFPSIEKVGPAQRHDAKLAPRGWVDANTAAKQRGTTRQQLAVEARMGLIEARKLGGRWYYPPVTPASIDSPEDEE